MLASERAVVSRGDTLRWAIVGGIFCISGFSALVYQVAWQRILVLHSGVGIYSVAMVVAAFLAGIGLGSYVGGRLSLRRQPRMALRTFALLELAIGIFAWTSCYLYYDLLYLRFPTLYGTTWGAPMAHFLALLVPTTLMGMSLPFLVQATLRDARVAARVIGYLYGINVLGGALGALLAPWVLMRLLGIRGAVLVAALGNIAAGLVAWGLAYRQATLDGLQLKDSTGQVAIRGGERSGRRPLGLWLALYTTTGFVALSLEIVWFRIIDVAVKSTAFTFGTVLAIYLFGLGTGSLLGGPLAVRLRRPLLVFLLSQGVLLLYSAAAASLLVRLPRRWPCYRELVDYWGEYAEFQFGRDWDWPMIFMLYLILPVLLYGLPTVLMGFSFTVLQRAVQDDPGTAGMKVGILQTGNILGNVAGSLLSGLLLLELLGTPGTLRLLLVVGLGLLGVGVLTYGWRLSLLSVAAGLVLMIVLLPSGTVFWARLHASDAETTLVGEDASLVAAITPDDGKLRLSVNGKGHSWLPFGGIHSQLGAITAAIHPAPVEVAIIGLGSGDTAWAAAFRPQTQHVRVWEIGAPEAQLLGRIQDRPELSALRRFLADPRVRIIHADGRNALASTTARFDVIEADALRPHSAFSGNVYSLEFFQLCASRLKPGGMMCSWIATPRTYWTFCRAFPHVLEFEGEVLVGSNDPLSIDFDLWVARLRSPRALDYLGTSVVDETIDVLRSARPAQPRYYESFGLNRDLFPRDELVSPSRGS